MMRAILDLVILEILKTNPVHGYGIIKTIRKTFGVYFGPSTVYPLLAAMEKKGLLKSEWKVDDRPRRIHHITQKGETTLTEFEYSFHSICTHLNKIGTFKAPMLQREELKRF